MKRQSRRHRFHSFDSWDVLLWILLYTLGIFSLACRDRGYAPRMSSINLDTLYNTSMLSVQWYLSPSNGVMQTSDSRIQTWIRSLRYVSGIPIKLVFNLFNRIFFLQNLLFVTHEFCRPISNFALFFALDVAKCFHLPSCKQLFRTLSPEWARQRER